MIENVARLRDLRPGRQALYRNCFCRHAKKYRRAAGSFQNRQKARRRSISGDQCHAVYRGIEKEILYQFSIGEYSPEEPSFLAPHITMMPLDLNAATMIPLQKILRSSPEITPSGIGLQRNTCPFIEGGATAIAWDGSVSPCLPLLHNIKAILVTGCVYRATVAWAMLRYAIEKNLGFAGVSWISKARSSFRIFALHLLWRMRTFGSQ